ncbi:MAG: hypothetical protein AB7N91_18325 [Candidatus Tectimicrobiota bacterium]
MRRYLGKIFGGTLGLVSLFTALALAADMTCAKDNGKGQCTAVNGPEGRIILITGTTGKVGDILECKQVGTVTECQQRARPQQ